jgi:hypothetical protein
VSVAAHPSSFVAGDVALRGLSVSWGGKNELVTSGVAEQIAEGAGFVAVLSVGWVWLGKAAVERRLGERRARERAQRAEATAVEASWELEAFAPEKIRAAVIGMLQLAAEAWQGSVRPSGEGPVVVERWAQAHRLGADTVLAGGPVIDLLGVVHRAPETEDRVVVRIRAVLRSGAEVPLLGAPGTLVDERWTLARRGSDWELVEFDDTPLADELLHSPLIAGAWADQDRLREQSLAEVAQGDPVNGEARTGDLVDSARDPMLQLLDLSVIDGRYLPALLQATLIHLIDVWEQATAGTWQPLADLASPEACDQLLYPRADDVRMRMVLRDATLRRWQPELVVAGESGSLEIALTVSAVRFLVDPLTAKHVWGSPDYSQDIRLSWTLALTDTKEIAWRLVNSSDPAADIPGAAP